MRDVRGGDGGRWRGNLLFQIETDRLQIEVKLLTERKRKPRVFDLPALSWSVVQNFAIWVLPRRKIIGQKGPNYGDQFVDFCVKYTKVFLVSNNNKNLPNPCTHTYISLLEKRQILIWNIIN